MWYNEYIIVKGDKMGNSEFVKLSKRLVREKVLDIHGYDPTEDLDVYVVWLVKALQNNKALLSTTVSDGRYYEVTHNGDKDEVYVDTYVKEENKKHNI